MKKTLLITLLGASLALAGCAQQTPIQNQNSNQPTADINQNVNEPVVNQNLNTNQPATNVNQNTDLDRVINTPTKPAGDPREVVKNYVKYTLGIPANYNLAKQNLTPDLQSQFINNPAFVPQSYGIQDVPNSTTVNTRSTSDDSATIRVVGEYSSSGQVLWDFTVVVYNNEWRISEIKKVSD